MPFVGITPPSGGIPPERRTERDRKVRRVDRATNVERPTDEAELTSVERASRDDAVQDGTTEEGREDRAAHNTSYTYAPGRTPTKPMRKSNIDIKG